MNLFNFLRFSNIEEINNDRNWVFRLAQKKNGKFVLVDNSGKIVSPECDWISCCIPNIKDGIRFFDNGGILYYFTKEGNETKASVIPRVTDDSQENLPEIYATAEDNGITQIFLNGEIKGTLLINSERKLSDIYERILPANKKGFRLAWDKFDRGVMLISRDGTEIYEIFDSVSEPDENGVRIAQTDFMILNNKPITNFKKLHIEPSFAKVVKTETIYTLLPANFDKDNKHCREIDKVDDKNYRLTLVNDKQSIVNKNGNNVAGGLYYSISETNQLGEVIANRTRSKSKGGIVLIHDGNRYRKVDDMYTVLDSAPIGIKAMKYGKELNQNVVAGVNISEGTIIDPDVNRVLIALLKGEKPSRRFWKAIEDNEKFPQLFAGVDVYNLKLDEIAELKPELAGEIASKKENLMKSLLSTLKRKAAGHKAYEQTEDKKIEQHEQNISNSTTSRKKLDSVVNLFGKMNKKLTTG